MKKISIIIPVYKVEEYIERCILSAINQNLNKSEYEIIVIDDESPDSSVLIVKELQKRNPQIKLYSQKNKGLGGARNTGIQKAKGKYLLFLDADDILIENKLNVVLEFAISKKLDILEFGANGVLENKQIIYSKFLNTSHITNGYNYLLQNTYMNSACNKLYSLDFLNKKELLFEEQLFIEDFEFNTRAFFFAKRVIGIEIIVAEFMQTQNSITRNNDKSKNHKMINDIINVINLTQNFLLSRSESTVTSVVIQQRIGFLTVTLLYNLMKLNIDKQTRNRIIQKLKVKQHYPVKTKIKDFKKNIFKHFINNEFIFNLFCDMYNLKK